jgi:S1-C subfamily serine protease
MTFGEGMTPRSAALHNPVVEAVKAASPAVVNISTEKVVTLQTIDPRFDDELFRRFFEVYRKQNVKATSLGSGVLVDRRGYIVTNEHVVRRASKITVTLNDKSTYVGKLISADPTRDLAIVRIIRDTPFPTVNMNRREPLMIGETAIAVGNPFGFEHTVTVGVVSATGRTVTVQGEVVMKDLVQTDASINPGNSGGALLDANGDLIGINTAIRAGAEGIGFAIPIMELRKALVDLLDFQRLGKLWIGVGLAGLVDTNTDEPVGMRVTQMQPDSPAQKSGLKIGDIITKMNGRRCAEVLAFEVDVLESKAGDELAFEGIRDGAPFRATLKVDRLPVVDPNTVIARRLGMSVDKLSKAEADAVGIEPGTAVIVRSVADKGPAAVAGLKKDDCLLLFDKFRVTEPEELASGLGHFKAGDQAVIVLIRKGFKYYTYVHLD